jgi:hypothetical protein
MGYRCPPEAIRYGIWLYLLSSPLELPQDQQLGRPSFSDSVQIAFNGPSETAAYLP